MLKQNFNGWTRNADIWHAIQMYNTIAIFNIYILRRSKEKTLHVILIQIYQSAYMTYTYLLERQCGWTKKKNRKAWVKFDFKSTWHMSVNLPTISLFHLYSYLCKKHFCSKLTPRHFPKVSQNFPSELRRRIKSWIGGPLY